MRSLLQRRVGHGRFASRAKERKRRASGRSFSPRLEQLESRQMLSGVSQWASSVLDFSSQWSDTDWSAQQALGEPDVFDYGDYEGAWSPRARNGTTESITLGFESPVHADGVTIRQTWGNGFVRQVEVRDATSGDFEMVWSEDVDPSLPGSPVDFLVTFVERNYSVDAVRITTDTDHSDVWEQIDAVALHGQVMDDTTPPTATLADPPQGESISQFSLNARGYIDVTFTDLGGRGVNASTILDPELEFTLGGAAASGVTLDGAATLESGTTYRYDFSGEFGVGLVTVDFQPGTFADNAGNPNVAATQSFVVEVGSQWASSVIDFSSQWSDTDWSAQQALGEPDVFAYGDNRNAWCSANRDGTLESITLGFDVPVFADGVTIRETWGNGFVQQVEVRNAETGEFEEVSSGTDPSVPGSPVDYFVTFVQRTYFVDAVRITTDTDHSEVWEEIDAVALHGSIEVVTPLPSAKLADPPPGGSITQSLLNDRGYLDVTFVDNSGSGLNPETIVDDELEFTLAGEAASEVTLDGEATPQGDSTYRYQFTGTFSTGEVAVRFVAGTFADHEGNANLEETQTFIVTANRDPVAQDDEYTTDQNTLLLVTGTAHPLLLANDHDPDDDDLTIVDVDESNLPGGPPLRGGLHSTSAGAFIYNPQGAFGELTEPYPDRFQYTISDGNGGFDTATVTIWVTSDTYAVQPTAELADPLSGSVIQLEEFNARQYIDVTFVDTSGSGLDPTTITDDALEFTLGGEAASEVTLDGDATPQGDSTYRYSFTGSFGVGEVHVQFLAGAFADNDGNVNAEKSQSFTVQLEAAPPTAVLADPPPDGAISQAVLNARGYIDVTFDGSDGEIDASTITDTPLEFTLGGEAASGVTLNGAATLVSGTTYRYGFEGDFGPGEVTVQFLEGTFANIDGITNTATEQSFVVALASQWASSVIDFSSQWSDTGWSAQQALGEPDVFAYGDKENAWCPANRDGTIESITVGFETPVYAEGVTVRQTWGNGFVRKVEVRDAETGMFEEVWAKIDPSQPGSPVDFLASFPKRTYLVDAARITIDTDHSEDWEEIDAVSLHGTLQPPPAA